jgi:hypothetical protein
MLLNPFEGTMERLTITRKGHLEYTSNDGPQQSCALDLPACHDQSTIDVADLTRDLAAPDVQSAFVGRVFEGEHAGADGGGFSITRSKDGHVLSFNSDDTFMPLDCSRPSPQCVPITPAVQELVVDLGTLWHWMRAHCTTDAGVHDSDVRDAGANDAGS